MMVNPQDALDQVLLALDVFPHTLQDSAFMNAVLVIDQFLDEAYEEGEWSGYDAGHSDGYYSGYDEGHEDGYEEGVLEND